MIHSLKHHFKFPGYPRIRLSMLEKTKPKTIQSPRLSHPHPSYTNKNSKWPQLPNLIIVSINLNLNQIPYDVFPGALSYYPHGQMPVHTPDTWRSDVPHAVPWYGASMMHGCWTSRGGYSLPNHIWKSRPIHWDRRMTINNEMGIVGACDSDSLLLLGFAMHKIWLYNSSFTIVLVWRRCILGWGTWCRGPGMGCGLTRTEMALGSNLGVSILHGRGGLHVALVKYFRCGVTNRGMHRPAGTKRPKGMVYRRVVKRPICRGYRCMSDCRGRWLGWHSPAGTQKRGGVAHRRVIKKPICRGYRCMPDRRGRWLGWRSPAGTQKRRGVAHRRVIKRPICRGERWLSSERGRWLHSRSFSMGIAFLTARLEYLA